MGSKGTGACGQPAPSPSVVSNTPVGPRLSLSPGGRVLLSDMDLPSRATQRAEDENWSCWEGSL